MAAISGIVTDHNGQGVAGRTVRAYRRDTGALLGSSITSDGITSHGDQDWTSVALLIKGDGTNGGTTFTDSSPAAATVTRVNATTSTTQTKFQNASIYFDGDGDRLSVPAMSLTLPFTIEAWIYPLAANPIGLFDSGPNQAGALPLYVATPVIAQHAGLAFDPPANQWTWNQLIFEAVSGNLRLTYARNGSQVRQGNLATGSTAFTQGSTFVIGGINNNGDGSLNAYVSEFRITKTARTIATPSAALETGPYQAAGALGTFSIDTGAFTGDAYVLALDAGNQNARIFDRVIPV